MSSKNGRDDNSIKRDDCCLLSKKRDHAWDYFSLHANQRISVFKTYIVIFALFITSSGFMIIRYPSSTLVDEILEIGLCIIFIFLSGIFYLLDCRNRRLIKMAEEALVGIENCQMKKEQQSRDQSDNKSSEESIEQNYKKRYKIPIEYLFMKEDNDAKNTFFRHTACFRIIFCVAVFLAIILIFYSLVSICYYEKGGYSESYLLIHSHGKIECKDLFLDNDD